MIKRTPPIDVCKIGGVLFFSRCCRKLGLRYSGEVGTARIEVLATVANRDPEVRDLVISR